MPTLQQLPPATLVNLTDEMMLDQGGNSVSATVAQVLDAQPVGTGILMVDGTLEADTTVLATLASPALTGSPTAPTPPPGDNSTKIATTAFVLANAGGGGGGGGSGSITLTGDITGSGTGTVTATLPAITTPGTFEKVTVNAKGQVTAGATLSATDIGTALGYTAANQANISGATLTATGSTTARTAGARAADWINVLDFGADPTGSADSAPAFTAAMNAVASGSWGKLTVPRGTYKLNSAVNQPSGRSIAVVFEDGANITGSGYLGVDRVETTQGPYRQMQNSGGWFGFAPSVGSSSNPAFVGEYLYNTPQNSLSMRVGWDRRYTNYNLYGKTHTGIDIAEQRIHSWPNLYDNSSGWGLWEVIEGTTLDEDSAARASLSTSAEISEIDIVNNCAEAGWTWRSGFGNTVQGMSIDPWGQNGSYGGHVLFAYGSVGSYDGNVGGLNQRWVSYPAVFSSGNPSAVAQNSTITIKMDLTAQATANLVGNGVGSVSVSAGGGAYTSAPTVVFSGGGGSGAAGTAVMLGGSVIGVTMTAAGSGYTSAPTVSFTGGGVTSPSTVTVTLNTDGAHGDLASIAAAINAAAIPYVRAAVAAWGGVVNRLVIFGTNASDLGILTLGGTALGTLGISAGTYTAPRGSYAMVLGSAGSVSVGDKLVVNGTTITVGGAGAASDVASAIKGANLPGISADTNANGQLVITAWTPQNPGGLVLANASGYTTLAKVGLAAGTYWPPVPPKSFATARSDLTSPVCLTTDQITITATDLTGTVYGPVTVTLNGGAGTGWPADVAASIQAALTTAGFYSSDFTALSTPPAVVAVKAVGSGANQGVYIRNTAGGTLTLANAHGNPLEALGIAPGTYQPGGYSAGSQTVFMAAEDSIAPQGRGVFVGGASSPTDITTWPQTPLEVRGKFLHGIRMDNATLNDGNALVMAPGQTLAWGNKEQGQQTLTVTSAGTLQVNGAPVVNSAALDAAFGSTYGDILYRGATGWQVLAPGSTGQCLITNGAGLSPAWATSIPSGGANSLVATTGTAGVGQTLALGANLSVTSGTLSAAGFVSSVVAGSGLAGGTITTTGTISLGAIPAGDLLANTGTASAVPVATTPSALLDNAFGSTYGDILYRGATGWQVLAPGSTGQCLITNGAGLSPAWATSIPSGGANSLVATTGTAGVGQTLALGSNLSVSNGTLNASVTGGGAGTVTSIVAGSGLAGGTITTAGTISLGTIAAGDLLANTGTASAVPVATAPSALLDNAFGATQGNILYRGATGWAALGPGTAGQVLETGGASANPSWKTEIPAGATGQLLGATGTLGAAATVAVGSNLSLTSGTLSAAGSVSSVVAGSGLAGGTITSTGTISLGTIPNNEVLGNVSGSTAVPTGLTQTQLTALINAFTSSLSGAVPASGGGTTNFLRADGTWAAPSGGGSSTVVRGHIAGFLLSNDGTNPNTVLDVASGMCADSTAATWITTSSTFYCSTGSAWSAGAGSSSSPVGKMGSGLTIAASTWYHVFAIINGGSADIYFDTSITAAHAPSGTTAYRRIGSFLTNASAQILGFTEAILGAKRYFYWATIPTDFSGASSTGSRSLITLSVPPGINAIWLGRIGVSGASQCIITSPLEPDNAPASSVSTNPGADATGSGSYVYESGGVLTNTSSQIGARSNTSQTMYFYTRGWIESAGAGQ
jgi:hypothetical protein